MRFLLDTSILLWSVAADHKLNPRARRLLSAGSSQLYLSAASVWEIAIKCAVKTLELPSDPAVFIPTVIQAMGLRAMDISSNHSIEAGGLPQYHRDPFDRMLIAQARIEQLTLLTADTTIRKYDVEQIHCGT